jgi:hypothetical protein
MKLGNLLTAIISNIIIALLFLPYPAGIYHSYNYHSKLDLLASIFIPPYGYYRGIETLWHDHKENETEKNEKSNSDSNEKDTEDKIRIETQLIAFLAQQSVDKKTTAIDIQELLKLNNRIKNYSQNTRNEIKYRTKIFINYYLLLEFELLRVIVETNASYKYIKSEELMNLENELVKFGFKNKIEVNDKEFDEFNNKMAIRIIENGELPKYKKEIVINSMKKEIADCDEKLQTLYKDIFDEELNP